MPAIRRPDDRRADAGLEYPELIARARLIDGFWVRVSLDDGSPLH
jgi:hypothetical protein